MDHIGFSIFFVIFSCLLAGGKKFRTTLDTLTQREPDSMLAAMFSGRHTLSQDPEEVRVFSIGFIYV